MAGGCVLDLWSWTRTNGVELLGDALAVAVVWCCSRSSIGAIGIILLLRVTMVQSLVGLPLLRA